MIKTRRQNVEIKLISGSLKSIGDFFMWVRFHKPPKLCRKPKATWGAKEHYYNSKSFARYSLTNDGLRMTEIAKEIFKQGEIGAYESTRFFIRVSV